MSSPRRFGALIKPVILLWLSSGSLAMAEVSLIVDGVYSGGEPDEEIFAKLESLGVRTLISVDGKVPDVAAAREMGARYIHLPIGYDGISEARAEQFAYAFRSAPRPLYIHCHHGLHRGPAALALGLISTGEMRADQGLKLLEKIGTSKDYGGLWERVREAEALNDIRPTPLPEVTEVSDFTAQMSLIDEHFDTVQALSRNEWEPLAEHPDVTAKQAALLLYEAFRELNRAELKEVSAHEAFPDLFQQSEKKAYTLYEALQAGGSLEEGQRHFRTLKNDCRSCHRLYRD